MSKKIGLNQGWYLRVAASLALVVAIALPSNSSDVSTKESPWNELKTVTSEVKQENTTTDTKNKTAESSELEQKQVTPKLSHNPCIDPNCDPLLDNCWICQNP